MDNIIDIVKEKWNQLTAFSKKTDVKDQLWEDILYRYSEQHRYYHTLSHIAHLFNLCDKYMSRISNPAVVGFAILYHDIVYDTYRHDNEEQSAVVAEEHLKKLNVNPSLIKNVQTFILASKDHEMPEGVSSTEDLALFLDFDMAILAEEEELYNLYKENIRQEYSKYADPLYKEGRKIALQKILAAKNIFATPDFRAAMEDDARQNIRKEIATL